MRPSAPVYALMRLQSPFNTATVAVMIVAAAAAETVPCDVVDTPVLRPTREHQRSAPMSCRCPDIRTT